MTKRNDNNISENQDSSNIDVNDAEAFTMQSLNLHSDTRKCKNCGFANPKDKDTCQNCGHYMREHSMPSYMPMSEEKIKKIRFIVGTIAIVLFLIIFFVLR